MPERSRAPGADLPGTSVFCSDAGQALFFRLCGDRRRHGRAGVEMQVIVDPSLVGGFVLEIDGTTYNKSVSGQLHRLARRLQER